MQPEHTPNGYRFTLESGVKIDVSDIAWTNNGRVFADITATNDAGVLGGGKVELSSTQGRYLLAKELANHNGRDHTSWGDALLTIWDYLHAEREQQRERINPVDLAEFSEPGPQQFIWGNVMPQGLATSIYGDGGAGKSTTVNGLAVSIAMGYPFLGMDTQPGPVVLLDWELNQEITLRRLYQIARGMGLDYLPTKSLFYQSLADTLAVHAEEIAEWCERINPALVVVDSVGPASGGDPLDHARVIALLNQLRKIPQTKLLVDHQSKPSGQGTYATKREFGSAFKGYLVRSSLQIERASNSPGKSSIIMRHQKTNFGPMEQPVAYHMRFDVGMIWFEMGDIEDVEFCDVETLPMPARIERFLRQNGPSTMQEIMDELGMTSEGTFLNAMTSLRKAGKVPREADRGPNGTRFYRLVDQF